MENRDFPKIHKLLLDLHEAGQLSGISPWSLRDDVRSGKLPCFRRGGPRGKIFIAPRDLDKYLASYRIDADHGNKPKDDRQAIKSTSRRKTDASVRKMENFTDDLPTFSGGDVT